MNATPGNPRRDPAIVAAAMINAETHFYPTATGHNRGRLIRNTFNCLNVISN